MVTRTFGKAPSTAPLMLKAVLPALPVIGGLPGIKHAKGSVPDIVLERKGVVTDVKHLEAYNEVCGFPRGDHLPATYPHMAAFGLHMALMTDTAFPFAPMGLVHLRNTIRQHRPLGVAEAFDVSVRAADLRPHPKGSLVDLVTEISVNWRARMGRGHDPVLPPQGRLSRDLAGSAGRRRGAQRCRALEARGRPRPPLRVGVGRPQPDPPLPADRQGVRLPHQHRARHVDPGPQPLGDPEQAAGRVHGRRRVPQADPAPGHCRVRLAGRRQGPGVRRQGRQEARHAPGRRVTTKT